MSAHPQPGQSDAAWWPFGGPAFYLVDQPEDGYVEEWCWVPVRAVDSDAFAEERALTGPLGAALAFIESATPGVEMHDKGFAFAFTGERTWQRPLGVPDGEGEWVVAGDGRPVRREFCPWESCEPDAVNAVEFYVLELVEQ